MPIAKSVEDTILGEAKAGNFEDMVAIASVIDNRARQTKTTYEDVVAAPGQFDAFGKALPPGVGKYRDMAKQAVAQVKSYGPVHSATFYATPAATKGLPKGLAYETKTAGHQFFSDPKGRAIATAQGYKTPDPAASRAPTNVAGDPAGTLYDVTEARAATPVDGLLADFSSTTGRGLASPPSPAQQATSPFGSVLGLPDVGPTPTSRPNPDAPRGLAALSPSFAAAQARSGMSFKSPTVETAFASMAPSMQSAYKGIARGLADPQSYTVTSTAEPRGRSPSRSHVGDKAAIDVRTRDMDTKALDDLAVAAMYDKGIKSISWDHTGFAPHAHLGTTTPYGKGLQAKSDISRLSPDVQDALRGWDESQRGLRDDFAPMVPESIAPTPTPAPRGQETYSAPVGPVERGTLGPVSAPAVAARGMTAPNFAGPIGPSYNIDQAGLTAPSFTGPATRSVSTQSIGRSGLASPSGTTYGPAGTTPAGFAELGVIGKTSRPGVAAPSFAPPSIVGPIAMPTQQPYFAPVAPAIAPPAMAPPVAPPTVAAPAMPSATGYDVWSGVAQTAPTTGGGRLSRNPDGSVSMTSKYGYTEVDGQYRGKVDPNTVGRLGQVGIPGPLGNVFGRTAPSQQQAPRSFGPSMRGIGPAARGMAGAAAGSVVGGMLGPLGAVLGATIGRNLATGKTALGKFQDFGRVTMPTPTQARSAFAQGFTPGLGFPTAPTGNASQGGLTDFGREAARGDHGGQAQSAANSPGRGLY